ncbi:MAG TPA: hypothetical protein VHQ22_12225 [Terriglobales bacterium]|jgi:hypothetical protein|nr:hypothetical protein [Terriglobales bacterium]
MADNYMQRVNPNLIIAMHYSGKALWLVLAAVFGLIGYKLYALGVQSPGNARASLPLGISFTLDNAGPGLVVMVMALLCSLIGAVKSKVELSPESIRLMATKGNDTEKNENENTKRAEILDTPWSLTEFAPMYRIPVSELVSDIEKAEIERLQGRNPLPEFWFREVSSVVYYSPRFREWLRKLPTRNFRRYNQYDQEERFDPSLPWAVRLRWGAGVTRSVDIFVYTMDQGPDQTVIHCDAC